MLELCVCKWPEHLAALCLQRTTTTSCWTQACHLWPLLPWKPSLENFTLCLVRWELASVHWCKVSFSEVLKKKKKRRKSYCFIKDLLGTSVQPPLPLPHQIRFWTHSAKQRAAGLLKIWSSWWPLYWRLPRSDICFTTWIAHQLPPAHYDEGISAQY